MINIVYNMGSYMMSITVSSTVSDIVCNIMSDMVFYKISAHYWCTFGAFVTIVTLRVQHRRTFGAIIE